MQRPMLIFVRQFFKEFKTTGALVPSSPALARAMTRSIRERSGPRRILEVGPGTGPFTKFILNALRPGDEFHVVEINRVFAQRLEQRMLAPFRALHSDIVVKLHCESIESVQIDGRFQHIICGLPFNNFPPSLVRAIFRRLIDFLEEDGELTYFEYAGVRALKAPLVGTQGRRQLKAIGATGKILRRKHSGKRQLVIGNVPPAVAVRLVR